MGRKPVWKFSTDIYGNEGKSVLERMYKMKSSNYEHCTPKSKFSGRLG